MSDYIDPFELRSQGNKIMSEAENIMRHTKFNSSEYNAAVKLKEYGSQVYNKGCDILDAWIC